MKSSNLFIRVGCALILVSLSACGKKDAATAAGPITVSRPNGTTIPAVTGANVMPFTVNGATCSSGSYPNKPCVSVKVCTPGTATCQTINDILLDTGSYGLRVFKSVINTGTPALTLTPVTVAAKQAAECVEYGDGSKQWGPIQIAGVGLGDETPVSVPIQIIDSTYAPAAVTANCSGAVTTTADAGFNGILGVGLFKEDCGTHCTTSASNGLYFACDGTACSGSTLSLANQVQNPVASLATDNNGVIIELPNIPTGGAISVSGYMVLGIGTQTNNTPGAGTVTTYSVDASLGEFSTAFNGKTYDSFLDTGSNALSFPATDTRLADCGGTYAGWLCPTSTLTLTATNTANSGGKSGSVTFPISNFITLWNTASMNAFIDIGSAASGGIGGLFDWGLPFFYGRNTYVGIEGTNSSLGAGPYWSY